MTKQQRLVLVVSILASMVAAIDGFIVNVALPTIARELHGSLALQQWTTDAYPADARRAHTHSRIIV